VTYEVEQKFHAGDPHRLERLLQAMGTPPGPAVSQADTYLSHPARDFARTDEALRVRRVGPAGFLTYKGPRVDLTTKTRLELELPLGDGEEAATRFTRLLTLLGFAPVADVRKRRRTARVSWGDRSIEVCLDEVEGLGTFVELETAAEEADLDAARRSVASLAEHLGLTRDERRSYLELLLDRGGGASPA
jgi:adenylate cyclase, class 2